jgi:hypothetical protein
VKTGDLEPPWTVDLSDSGAQANLSGVVSWQFLGYRDDVLVFTDSAPTVTVGTPTYEAVVEHDWVAGQTDTAGTLRGVVIATWPSGRPQTFPGTSSFRIEIEEDV